MNNIGQIAKQFNIPGICQSIANAITSSAVSLNQPDITGVKTNINHVESDIFILSCSIFAKKKKKKRFDSSKAMFFTNGNTFFVQK